MSDYVPTIDDLRVKICYICRDEEHFDNPTEPKKAWTHPCKCTLIAHESCLLEWLRSAQNRSDTAGQNALKCPQCGSQYEIQSRNPIILRLLRQAHQAVQKVGTAFTIIGGMGIVGLVSSVSVWILTKYGVFAVRQFFGEETFQLYLTEDISNWPFVAFINLPLIPISLIYSRFGRHDLLPVINVLLNVTSGIRYNHIIGLPDNNHTVSRPSSLAVTDPNTSYWPPTPLMFSLIIFPLTRFFYRRYHRRFATWVLGGVPPEENRGVFGAANQPAAAQGGQQQAQEAAAPEPEEGGLLQLQILVNEVDEVEQPEQQQPQPAPAANAPAPAQAAAPAPAAEPVPRRRVPIEIDASSLGRRVLGALLIPSISSGMGNLLLKLSERLPLLRQFLAVRPKWNGVWPTVPAGRRNLEFKSFLRAFVGGVGPLPALDPVWWRNSVGLGIFVVVTDCLHLCHLWLSRRELNSRHVKNKDFSGIDINALDLIPGWQMARPMQI